MIKIIDIDELFDKYISDYVYKNIGKVKPEEIENEIPRLYVKFGNEKLKELDDKTPSEYYSSFSAEELNECIKAHIDQGVEISDFLCEAMRDNKDSEEVLNAELNKENKEELIMYYMNILNDKNSHSAYKRFLEFVLWDYSEPIKELATEMLCTCADLVKEDILTQFKDATAEIKGYLTEILSYASKDDKVFDILIEQFVLNSDKISIYAQYLSRYNDDKALPFLYTAIENDKIDYADFEELRFAIEALGGEYTKERDFSADKIYKKISELRKDKK